MRLIDADALEKGKYHSNEFGTQVAWKQGWNDAVDAIINYAPTVKTINPGRWIKVEDDYNNHIYECSCCHTWTSLPTEDVNDGNIRYCWSCGAKMDGVKKDGDT